MSDETMIEYEDRIKRKTEDIERKASVLEKAAKGDYVVPSTVPPFDTTLGAPKEAVHHPAHYGGADNPYEAIRVIEAWDLGFCLGNTVKYICRAGKKEGSDALQDLEKSRWYLDREIARLKAKKALKEEESGP